MHFHFHTLEPDRDGLLTSRYFSFYPDAEYVTLTIATSFLFIACALVVTLNFFNSLSAINYIKIFFLFCLLVFSSIDQDEKTECNPAFEFLQYIYNPLL